MLLLPSSNYTKKKKEAFLLFSEKPNWHKHIWICAMHIFSIYFLFGCLFSFYYSIYNQNHSYRFRKFLNNKFVFVDRNSVCRLAFVAVSFELATRNGAAISFDRSSFQPKWHNTKYSIWQSNVSSSSHYDTWSTLNRIFRWTKNKNIQIFSFAFCISLGH